MSGAMKPYPEYKDSALPWLGKIPSHWTEKRAKYFFREVDERSTTGEEQLMSVSHKTGVTPRKSNVTMFKAESNIGHKICRVDDLAINTLWAWMSALGVSRYTGLVSPAYGVYRQIDPNNFNSEYVDYLLRTPAYATEYRCLSTGITSSRLRLYPIDFLRIPLVQPPRDEQDAIVRFLKHLDVLVRQFIRNRRRLIEVLTEQKQAIINRAVTRGLDPNVKLKPSGVDWLGDVPEHWTVTPLRLRYDQCLGKMVDSKQFTGKNLIPYLRNIDVQWDRVNTSNLPVIDIETHERDRFLVREGDLLVCEGGDVGRSAFWRGELGTCAFQKALHRLRPLDQKRDCARFLFYGLYLASKLGVFAADGSENTIAHLTGVKLRAHRFAFPPVEEQIAIAEELDLACATIDTAIKIATEEIDQIKDYRRRLIADIVSGSLDVRGAELDWESDAEVLEEIEDDDDKINENLVEELDDEVTDADD
jgi:type I restriction enzyme S subunit